MDASRVIADSPVPEESNVGIVTAQAGPGIIIADELNKRGAKFPDLTPETQESVDELLQGITYTGNPVNTGRPLPDFGEVIDAVGRDKNDDILIVYENSLGYPLKELEIFLRKLINRYSSPLLDRLTRLKKTVSSWRNSVYRPSKRQNEEHTQSPR